MAEMAGAKPMTEGGAEASAGQGNCQVRFPHASFGLPGSMLDGRNLTLQLLIFVLRGFLLH